MKKRRSLFAFFVASLANAQQFTIVPLVGMNPVEVTSAEITGNLHVAVPKDDPDIMLEITSDTGVVRLAIDAKHMPMTLGNRRLSADDLVLLSGQGKFVVKMNGDRVILEPYLGTEKSEDNEMLYLMMLLVGTIGMTSLVLAGIVFLRLKPERVSNGNEEVVAEAEKALPETQEI